jgi:hypothetical protein
MLGLQPDSVRRCSTFFLLQLFHRARNHALPGDPAKIVAEVRFLDGYGRPTGTKDAMPFDDPPLAGLWHKHYLADNAVARNVQIGLGGPSLKRIPKIARPFMPLTAKNIPDLARALINNVYIERQQHGKLTGEWIVFAKHEGQNYYLCLGNHDDGDPAVFQNVEACMQDFPFLRSVI